MADGQPIDLTIWLFLRYIRLCRDQVKMPEVKDRAQRIAQNFYGFGRGRRDEPQLDPLRLAGLEAVNNAITKRQTVADQLFEKFSL